MSINKILVIIGLTTAGIFSANTVFSNDMQQSDESRGKYLIEITGCNDCHTAGYAPSGGEVPEGQWLLGDSLGYRGPWGTTYPPNLRQLIQKFDEDEWVAYAKNIKTRPPMPWWSLNAMTTGDLKAMYKFIKALGLSETSIPSYIPPGEKTNAPYIQWPEPLK